MTGAAEVPAGLLLQILGMGRFAGGPDAAAAELGLLPRSLRRGLSRGMKFAIDAAGQAVAHARAAGAPAGEWPIVYGSAVGETETAVELLTSIMATRESSPVSFRHSVHNAAPGLMSIALHSLGSSMAVAAGAETLLAVLLEAAALVHEGAPAVLLVVAEEGPSQILAPGRATRAGAVAWVVGPAGSSGDQAAAAGRVYLTVPERVQGRPSGGVGGGDADPLTPAWQLADATAGLSEGGAGPSATAVALGRTWQVRVARAREALG